MSHSKESLPNDKQSFFVKGSTIMDKEGTNLFPGEDSSDSESMIGGLGSQLKKD